MQTHKKDENLAENNINIGKRESTPIFFRPQTLTSKSQKDAKYLTLNSSQILNGIVFIEYYSDTFKVCYHLHLKYPIYIVLIS